jgi:hypothetical protein
MTAMAMTEPPDRETRYDLFISYARNPDYRLARALDSFLESFHTIGDGTLRPLSVCRDGSDFSLGAVRPAALPALIRPYLERSDKLLVLCSANATREDSWVPQEIEWFLKMHEDPARVILAVTDEGQNVFPAAVLARALHERPWYDFRGARAKKRHPYQDFDEARVQLAADLNGRSAGEVLPVWRRQQQIETRKKRVRARFVGAIGALLVILAAFAVVRARDARRATAAQQAEELANGAEKFAAPGPGIDVVRAFHLAVRAAMRAPAGHPSTPLHVARVFHIAATLPVASTKLQQQEHALRFGVISNDGRFVLATDSAAHIGVWTIATGERMPLPFARDTLLQYDNDTPEGLLQITPDGTTAAAILDDGPTLTVWEIRTGRLLGRMPDLRGRRPFFSRDSVSMINRSWCADRDDNDKRCCWNVLWQKRPSDPPELREPCIWPVSNDRRRTLLYSGRRPFAVGKPDDRAQFDYAAPVAYGDKWAAARDYPVIGVAVNGWVFVWRMHLDDLLVRSVFGDGETILDAKLAASGDSLVVVNSAKRLAGVTLDGTEQWSAPLGTQDPRPLEEVELFETSDDARFLVTYGYDPRDYGAFERLELWRERASRPERSVDIATRDIIDLVLDASTGGGTLVGPSFAGFTRDAAWHITNHESEVQLVGDERVIAPFPVNDQSISANALTEFLRQAHGIRQSETGITATLRGGRILTVHRDAAGSWLDVDGHVVRSTGGGSAHCFGRDFALLAEHGSGTVAIREVASGRVLAAHFPSARLLGFTKDCRELFVNDSGTINAYFVHGGHDRAPPWFRNLPAALTGMRMSDDLVLIEIPPAERRRLRANVAAEVQRAARAGDAGAAFLMNQFFRNTP